MLSAFLTFFTASESTTVGVVGPSTAEGTQVETIKSRPPPCLPSEIKFTILNNLEDPIDKENFAKAFGIPLGIARSYIARTQ